MPENKIYNLKNVPEEDRPRERLIDKGPDILKNFEFFREKVIITK